MSKSKDILPKIKMASSSSSSSNQHLIDSLTSHISLYHSSLSSSCNLSPHPRSSILKWFSSLTPNQRQSTLTIISRPFIHLLLSMLKELNFKGNGHFLVLPDMPSDENPLIPSLCFRKIKGLLARVSETSNSERLIRDSVRLFESREGERVEESAGSVERLDSLVMCEELLSNVDRFVEVMDELSNHGFLRGEVTGLAGPSLDWIELGWLKDKGYYSLEAFVANRVEVALRIAWSDRKKNGGKVGKVNVSGIAANVYWRKKGCVDWWDNMDAEIKRKVLTSVLGKTAKTMPPYDHPKNGNELVYIFNGALNLLNRSNHASNQLRRPTYACASFEVWINEVLKSENSGFRDEMLLPSTGLWYESKKLCLKPCGIFPEVAVVRSSSSITSINYSGKYAVLAYICKGLSVLQDIYNILLAYQCGECDRETLFFTTLYSVHTSMDFMFRKLRGLLMTISLECTKVELLEGGIFDSPSVSCKEKKVSANRRKKGRNRNGKRQDTVQAPDVVHPPHEPIKDCRLADPETLDNDESNKMGVTVQEKDIHFKTPFSAAEVKRAEEVSKGKVRTAARKRRKERRKIKRSRLCDPAEEGDLEATTAKSSPSPAVICKAVKPNCSSEISAVHNSDSMDHSRPVPESVQFSDMVESQAATSSSDNSIEDYCSGNNSVENSGHLGEKRANTGFEVLESREETIFNEDRELRNFSDSGPTSSSGSSSYEWPSVAPVPFSIINSNLPAATDRLHLDVGSNWHNHFHQSFMPAVRQARSPAVQSGRNRIHSRPLPMSLDWPPVVRGFSNLVPPVVCNYDSRFISRRLTSFQPALASHSVQIHAPTIEDEKKHDGDMMERKDIINALETADECDSRGISEEELELHGVSGMDYNQFFGGGVMYWNPSDHTGKGFSRPPSLSSDDSSWAWHESEMRRTIDDMVAFSSSYSTNGLTSPTAASFCSPFEPLGPGHQALGYVVQGNEVTGKVIHSSSSMTDVVAEEGVSRSMVHLNGDVDRSSKDALPYPLLRPIIIPNMSNERSRSELCGHDHKSPCFPPSRREQPRIKRPPSPVVLCVPRAPRPPPPSPMSDSRKHKGFPTVRSGSSSPRNWGLRGMYYDGTNAEESCVSLDGPEAFWPSWRSNNFSTHPIIQPLPGALLQDRLLAMSQLAREQEHPDVAFPLQPPELVNSSTQKACLSLMQKKLHDEIDSFCRKVAAEKMVMKPYINWAVKRVTRSLQVLWPRSRTNIFGSNATGLSLPSSDVDVVVCLPPVRNLEPIKEAGILEGRNGIKETCLQHAARYLVNQEWVKNDSLKTVENTAIPIIMLVVEVPSDLVTTVTSSVQTPKVESTLCNHLDHSHLAIDDIENTALASHEFSKLNFENKALKSVRLDISFKSPSHTGLQTTELVKQITERFPAVTPLALVLKQFLADRSLDQSYSGGLSSYCLVLIITRFLQHEHHLGRPIYQNFGSLLMDFLYFFGNVFDPRQMRISVQGSGVYIKRERGHSIDPIHIDDPHCPTNNVGRNCFRIHQCIKAFSDAHSALENELNVLTKNGDSGPSSSYKLLSKIIPSIDLFVDGKHSKES